MRRSYKVSINVNRRKFDEVILFLVLNLNGRELEPVGLDAEGFEYFVTEPMYYNGKPHRLVWLIDPEDSYIGVINCFRRPKK